MRVFVQRVSEASVIVDNEICSEIGCGVLILLGIENADNVEDIDWLCSKIAKLRIFPDVVGIMNLSLMQKKGEALVVSQFTLHASTKKGNRPSYIKAARPEFALPLYEEFISRLTQVLGKKVETGKFGADMKVSLINDGPVSIWIDSKSKE
ncbi:MAG: D-aminoacyl-tRNA deacylase [Flavobacteriales bacterium]|nr:D-aminoacyl-tRNA deacylase [Flavobacteriales bacterium]